MNIGLFVLGSLMTIYGLFLCYNDVKHIILYRKAKSFPFVMGTILSTIITEVYDSDGVNYYPEVKYKYVVDGVPYECEGVEFVGKSWPSHGKAQSIIKKYPSKSQVRVYYEPENPKLSSLSFNLIRDIIMWSIGGTVLVGLGVICLLGGFGIWSSGGITHVGLGSIFLLVVFVIISSKK